MQEVFLTQLLEQTKELLERASKIDFKMEKNENDQLEAMQELFEERQVSINQLSAMINLKEFSWTLEDREKIAELKAMEQSLQPLITSLHESFGDQLKRVSESKKMSMKYAGAYQNMGTGGSFIDKRK